MSCSYMHFYQRDKIALALLNYNPVLNELITLLSISLDSKLYVYLYCTRKPGKCSRYRLVRLNRDTEPLHEPNHWSK